MDELLEVIQSATKSASRPEQIVIALLLSAILGGFLAMVYRFTYTGKRNNLAQFTHTLVLLCLGGSLVWIIVADNLARAFGLAGALALVRFRTRMRDPKDTTLIFFAIIVGMACGLHQYFTAIYGSLFIGLVLVAIFTVNRISRRRYERRRAAAKAAAKEAEPPDNEPNGP